MNPNSRLNWPALGALIGLLTCVSALGQSNTFPLYVNGSGANPPTSTGGFASGFVTYQAGTHDVITLNLVNYSVSSPINEILFQYQFTPESGALTQLPFSGTLPASGTYTQSFAVPLSDGPDILQSLENDLTTLTIGTVDYPVVGVEEGEISGPVGVVPEFSHPISLPAFALIGILLFRYRLRSPKTRKTISSAKP
jgi:hypothetical protein